MRGWQLAAAKGAISSTLSLCESAAAAGLSCPGPAPGGTTSWRTYSAQLEGLLARGEVPAAWTAWADADAAAAAAAAAATVTAAGGRDGMASHGGEVSAPDMHRARASHAATGATRNQGAEAVLAHLRLQLLLLEEVFSGATGEMRYIDRGTADGASPGDEDEEGQGDCMEEGSALAASDAPEAAGNRGGRRGSKRPGPGADGAREGADGADSADGPVAKRGRSAGATGMGLPPRPEARMHADRSGSAAVPGPKAVPNSGSPAGSREGSAAPPPLGAAQRKRGRGESVIATLAPVTGSAGTSRASSAEPCCEESTVPHVPRGRKQARNAKASAPGGASVAPDMSAAAGSVAPESDTDAKDQGRRRSAPSAALRRTGDASGGQVRSATCSASPPQPLSLPPSFALCKAVSSPLLLTDRWRYPRVPLHVSPSLFSCALWLSHACAHRSRIIKAMALLRMTQRRWWLRRMRRACRQSWQALHCGSCVTSASRGAPRQQPLGLLPVLPTVHQRWRGMRRARCRSWPASQPPQSASASEMTHYIV